MTEHKIAYQGTAGAFSHTAAQLFAAVKARACPGLSFEFMACETFADAFKHVSNCRAEFACLPFENSSIGSIRENFQLLWDSDLTIKVELFLPVHHQLLAIPGSKFEQIKEVYSHPVALAQCKRFFAENRNIQAVSFLDTGAAASYLLESGKPELAAIASREAAANYGLEILKSDIQDFAGNQTRFLLLAREGEGNGAGASELPEYPMKLSLGILSKHSETLFSRLGKCLSDTVSLVRIESLADPSCPFSQHLVLDFLLGGGDGLEELRNLSLLTEARNFGSYQRV